jgi:hypothetical protein
MTGMTAMPALDDLRRDLRDGLRALTRHPGFTAVAVLSLVLGIGANTAIFSLVNAVRLREVPLVQPEQLVNLYMHSPTFRFGTFSYPDYKDVRDGTREVFSGIGASQFSPVQIDGDSGVDLVFAEVVTGSYFRTLGVEAMVGRTVLPEDDVSPGLGDEDDGRAPGHHAAPSPALGVSVVGLRGARAVALQHRSVWGRELRGCTADPRGGSPDGPRR